MERTRLTEVEHEKLGAVIPKQGQVWEHKQFGGEFTVERVEGGSIRIMSTKPGAMSLGMHEAQLVEHYVFVR